MKIVISQPMYFPWVGMFEQVNLCDAYVNYDDVQFSKGSFTNRVQIKTNSSNGFNWLTVPLKQLKLGILINELEINNQKNWQNQHLEMLKQAYKNAPYFKEMLGLVRDLFDFPLTTISEVSMKSMELSINYFDLAANKTFYDASRLGIEGGSSERVYQIVKYLNGTHYITGHGAKNYLDHSLFENNSIRVEYMNYLKLPYPQQFSTFNPYVSILDLIANIGKQGKEYIKSSTIYWKEFLA
ncbi:MAG: WbqC family protein [Pseudanabaena sp. M135S2SP2A07QC]|uniref:WbqC family protein n=1 Tax=unclassified Microcystis TaxID=2643300 RepID=UPI002585DA79|nr:MULTISPECIES: WbqC family protein [unclassified Microcystis]MCA6534548.1 WbqC family protein [Pseudanabaena sp. M176S2SP2A07QC]MCA6537257.1 WbqC family protein [Pseudanabaena sp. M037S2SP2A07QC]MCA6548973.1 WbqC family protein [Pseudanabaena sp. M152S2SP2A07QC]MCA6553354.1 WbqC family protein [Pseudanabaena sp. M135S2SP2A07QC]MCA6564862.1 WbqC family protein [Pseudanabaena sp. M151S2SP2A07QC]MCA6571196.1 WbqC family protein [Pseudanabaena sp. M065S1SP2A07QC]MCA6579779.1 WbqC family protei